MSDLHIRVPITPTQAGKILIKHPTDDDHITQFTDEGAYGILKVLRDFLEANDLSDKIAVKISSKYTAQVSLMKDLDQPMFVFLLEKKKTARPMPHHQMLLILRGLWDNTHGPLLELTVNPSLQTHASDISGRLSEMLDAASRQEARQVAVEQAGMREVLSGIGRERGAGLGEHAVLSLTGLIGEQNKNFERSEQTKRALNRLAGAAGGAGPNHGGGRRRRKSRKGRKGRKARKGTRRH